LCTIDLNAAPGAGVLAGGLAPVATADNPSTDVQLVSGDVGRDVVESFDQANARVRKAQPLGRLVSSLDGTRFGAVTSSAPSVIGSSGTPGMLGGIADVTPAVWRTLEVKHHAKVADNGARLTIDGSATVKPRWSSFVESDADASGREALMYTTDGAQLY